MPVPTYTEPLSPSTGEVLGATHANLWQKSVEYLHGFAAGGYEPFTGRSNFGNGEMWRGYYTYTGVKWIYHDIRGLNISSLSIYASHDAGESLVGSLPAGVNQVATTPIDLSAYSFTIGKQYYVRVVCDGMSTVNWVAVPVTNNLSWSTPTTFTDGNTSSAADFSNLTSNCNFLRKILEVPRGTFKGVHGFTGGGGTVLLAWNGSFLYKGLNTLEATINTTNFMDEAYIYITDIDSTNIRTVWYQSPLGGSYTVSADISSLSPALSIGTRYRVYVTAVTYSPNNVQRISVWRMMFTGDKTLTNAPKPWLPGDYGLGSSGSNRLAYISSSLTDIKALCETVTIAGQVYGLQDLSVNNAVDFEDFRRTRRLRYLKYMPTGTGATGTLTYGDATQSLPDNNGDGTWTSFDLETIPLLPIGFTYKVTGVVACFESMTG